MGKLTHIGGRLGVAAAVTMAGLMAGVGCAPGGQRARAFEGTPLPAGAIGYYIEGVLAHEAGRDDQAVAALERAAREDPRLIGVNQVLGDAYQRRGEIERAAAALERLVTLDPGGATGYFRLGYAFELLTRFEDALATYEAGLTIRPGDVAGTGGAGRSALALGEAERARDYLQEATEQNPGDPELWLALGLAQDALDFPSSAETSYRRAAELFPAREQRVLEALGMNLVRQNKPADAELVLRQALEQSDAAPLHKLMGDALLLQSRFPEAISAYDRALERDPAMISAINAKGSAVISLYVQGGELDEDLRARALELWQESLALEPDQPRVRAAIERFSARERLFD